MKPFLFSTLCLLFSALPLQAARVEIKDGRFYVDGEPFLVRAVAYAPWRPHQQPGTSYVGTNRRWTDMDFQRIKAAHFNTVRTWDALDAEELALARKHGLMVIQGIRLDPRQDFSKAQNSETANELVRRVAENSRTADNILGYLLLNRAAPDIVLLSGLDDTRQFFRRMKRTIQALDSRPVAMDRGLPLSFFDETDSDFTAFNIYGFAPASLNFALTQAGLTRWLVERYGAKKPFLVTETGGYSVSKTSVTASGGLGGLSEYDQSLKNLDSLRASMEGHAQGTALVSWIDSWYLPRDPDTHDDEPWEWTGMLAIPTDSKKDMDGLPRLIVNDARDYNQLIPVEPKVNHFYNVLEQYPIEVFGSPQVATIRFSMNQGEWSTLRASGKGLFTGFFKLPKLAKRRVRITFEAWDKDQTPLARKDISIIAAMFPETVRVNAKSDGMGFRVDVQDSFGRAIPNRKVFGGCYYPVSQTESQATVTTNAQGQADFTCRPAPTKMDFYLMVAAGTDSADRVRAGDLRIFKVGK